MEGKVPRIIENSEGTSIVVRNFMDDD
jgi:hypothetical protein